MVISFQKMLPCNHSLPLSAKLNLTGSTNHSHQVVCSTSDLVLQDDKTTSPSITLAASFSCEIKLHEKYTGGIYSVESDNDQQNYLSAVSFGEEYIELPSTFVYTYIYTCIS